MGLRIPHPSASYNTIPLKIIDLIFHVKTLKFMLKLICIIRAPSVAGDLIWDGGKSSLCGGNFGKNKDLGKGYDHRSQLGSWLYCLI